MNVEARLRAFAAVAREESFSRAAQQLYVSQPAVSKHVASLEAELGVRLVDRARNGVTLTPAGRLVADYVLRAEALLANARRALAAGEEGDTGTLAVAASGIPGTYLLPELVAKFHARWPGIEIDLQVASSEDAVELVRAHRVEIAVAAGIQAPTELASDPLVEDELVLIGPPSLGGRRLSAKDIRGTLWLSGDNDPRTQAAVESMRGQIGLNDVRVLPLPSWEAVKLAVARGAGVAAISRLALDLELDAGTVAVLDVRRWRVARTISIVTARDVPLTPPAERFLRMLHETFSREDEPLENSNLPIQTTTLIGRDREVAEVAALVGERKIVTLTGTGGSGKTRLAIAAAAKVVDDFPDGVYLVDLARIHDSSLVVPTIASTLGLVDASKLREGLGPRQSLLVLDNFEHVLQAAETVGDIAAEAPGVRLLVTSREPLKLGAESEYQVEPLGLVAAVALFVDRARAVMPSFRADEVVETICRRLDCLPLAIELVASRVKILSPETLLQRLDQLLVDLPSRGIDVPLRQRTLRATLEWSYELLGERERSGLARFAVFRGGCTADALEAICDADLAVAAALIDKSLLRRIDGRLEMLETIRQFAAERLEEGGERDEMRRRHAQYFLAAAEQAAPETSVGNEQALWLERMSQELDNVRAALEFFGEEQDWGRMLRLATALKFVWRTRGLYAEGRRWLEEGLQHEQPPDTRMKALIAAFPLAASEYDSARAKQIAEEWLALATELDDAIPVALAFNSIGWALADFDRDYPGAMVAFERGLEIARSTTNAVVTGAILVTYGNALVVQRRYPEAVARFDEALELARETGHEETMAWALQGLGLAATYQGDHQTAQEFLRTALESHRRLDFQSEIASCLVHLALVNAAEGQQERAARLFGAASKLRDRLGIPLGYTIDEVFHDVYGSAVEDVRSTLSPASFDSLEAEGAALTVEEAAEYALQA